MKFLVFLGIVSIFSIGSKSFADRYICTVHRAPALKCLGHDFGTTLAPLEIETDFLYVGVPVSSYAGVALNPATINSPCEEFPARKITPVYRYEVAKNSKNQLELSVIEGIYDDSGHSTTNTHITVAPIGTQVVSTPIFTDSVVGEVSVSYECKKSGAEL